MAKKRNWKFWVSRTLLSLFLIAAIWVINLIWFRPFNVRHFYDKAFIQLALRSPETVTALGVPVLYDWSKDELDDVSDEKLWEDFNWTKEQLTTLRSYNFDRQSPENQLNTKILDWFLTAQVEGEPFFYHNYPVNQMFGIQSNLPSFMEDAHKIRNKSDVEAYLSRLSKFDTKFEQVLEGLKIREEKGIVPPKFVSERVLDEMKGFIGQEERIDERSLEEDPGPIRGNILYSNLATKVDSLDNLSEEEKTAFKQEAEEIIGSTVFSAYSKLIDFFEDQTTRASTDDGVWKLPDGDNYYAYELKVNTTTDLSPDQVHQIGLDEVARIKAEMWAILNDQGITDTAKTLGETIQALAREERFLFPDNDKGREMILAEYNRILEEISAGLDDAFNIRPQAALEVKRVPQFKEEGNPSAYYNGPPLDGSRGGIFYANLRDVKETPKFGMKTLAYHEGIPGHHFQIAIQSELKGVPTFRNLGLFTAYIEGWALYTERLAWELGFYENDPFGNLGRLQDEMMRAVRLVVDSGIHSKRWTREEAIQYMVEHTGMPTSEVVTEIERYIVMPGQACAYKIGMMKILELRERAKTELGNTFDLKAFHDVVLKNGAVPLDILEELVDAYIQETT